MTTPGSAAEEAGRLFAAVEDWVRTRAAGLTEELRAGEHLANGSPECSVCPLCQVVGAVRQVRPETVEHLLDAVASVAAALRTAVAPEPSAASRRSSVEHIDVRDG